MKNERLHTDEQLKSITLKQIAIDAEKWPRKQVEAFFERQGLENECSGAHKRPIVRTYQVNAWQHQFNNFDSVPARHIKLTLPDALRWEELQKGGGAEQNIFEEIHDKIKQVVYSEMIKEIAQLRAKITQLESEKEPTEEDRRVDFGEEVSFNSSEYGASAFIGKVYAKYGDQNKVLIAGEGYKWVLEEDYYGGRNAVSLVKTDGK